MTARKVIKVTTWPDPLVQERLEDIGFFYDAPSRTWVKFCETEESQSITDWLKKHHLSHEVGAAKGRGEVSKHPKLSDSLILKDGGSPTRCGLCAQDAACRQWVEGDDTDSTDYPEAARFYLCGKCVQTRMQAHPRLYSRAEEQL